MMEAVLTAVVGAVIGMLVLLAYLYFRARYPEATRRFLEYDGQGLFRKVFVAFVVLAFALVAVMAFTSY